MLSRAKKEDIVLAVQDTTSMNYSAHPVTEGLGPIGSSREGAMGLLLHDTVVFNLEGTPLGLLDVQCWARKPEEFGKKRMRGQLPIEQKESYKWLKSYQKVVEAQRRCLGTKFISVRETQMVYHAVENRGVS